MKNYKRAARRWKAKCKLEKRMKIWIMPGHLYFSEIGNVRSRTIRMGGCLMEDMRREIRDGKFYKFLRSTSTPCSCSGCSADKYVRPKKQDVKKQVWHDIIDFKEYIDELRRTEGRFRE